MPRFSAVLNHAADRPTPSCSARTTSPRGQITMLPLRTPATVIAGSIATPPTSCIQNTVSLELSTSMPESARSVWPPLTRNRSSM